MRYKVYLDNLEDKNNALISYSRNNISPKIEELGKVFNNVEWSGRAHSKYIAGYNARIEKLNKLNHNMELLGHFLERCHGNYNEANEKLIKSWDSFIEEIKGDENGL